VYIIDRKKHAKPLAWIRSGYNDLVAGRGFSQEYECADRINQMNYERGRLWASAWISIGRWPPAWPVTTIFPKLVAESYHICKDALPPERNT
jgi:hypothetical protein